MCCRNITFVAAVSSVIQSACCIAFGIVAMLMFDCKLTPTPIQIADPSPLTAFTNTFYLQYFHSQNNCIAINNAYWRNINDTQTGVATKSYQVHGMFIAYLVENSLWFVLSILLFFGGVIKSKWLFATYQGTQFTVMIYDTILIIIFALDFKSYKEFKGNTNLPWITKEGMLIDIIVMLLIVSRFVIFFVVNISLTCLMQGFINSLPSKPRPSPSKKSKNRNNYVQPAAASRNNAREGRRPSYDSNLSEQLQHQQQFQTSPYKAASRYPDVVSHPSRGQFDEGDDPWNGYPMQQQAGIFIPVHRDPMRHAEARLSSRMAYPSQESLQQPYPVRVNERRPTSRQQNRYQLDDNDSSEGYDDSSSRDTPRHKPYPSNNQDRRRQAGSSNNLPRSDDSGSQQNVRFAVQRQPSDRVSNEQLKNQRPWSYINPEELPSSPNKLNQFYISRNLKSDKTASTRALPSVDEYEPDEPPVARPSTKQQKREYNRQRHSVDSREPLLSRKERPRVDHIYANLLEPPPVKKNVRFSQRTQSLDYLETSFPMEIRESPAVKKQQQQRRPVVKSGKSAKSVDKEPAANKRNSKDWCSSGEELCTDEFLIVYGNKSQSRPPIDPVKERYKPSLTRSPSSTSSPNLVFDPVSNTARIVYQDRRESNKAYQSCRSQGGQMIHAPSCVDGRACKRIHLNETSI